MQNNVEIFITNETGEAFKLDVSDNADFAPRIYKRAVDPDELAKALGDYTLSLKLPRTARNHELFNFAHKIDSQFGFLNLRPYKCQVYANSYLVLDGEIELDQYTPEFIEATIYGQNIAWKSNFEGKRLRDIESFEKFYYSGAFGTDINEWTDFILNPDFPFQPLDNFISFPEVWTSDENSETFRGNKVEMQFPFMAWGNLDYPNPTNAPWQGFDQANPFSPFGEELFETANYEYGNFMLRNQERPFSFSDAHPANYLKTTIRKIFKDAGYEVTGKFMEDPATDNILIPFVGSKDELDYAYNWGILGRFSSNDNLKLRLDFDGGTSNRNRNPFYQPPQAFNKPINDDKDFGYFCPPLAAQTNTATNRVWTNVQADYSFRSYQTPAQLLGSGEGTDGTKTGSANATTDYYYYHTQVTSGQYNDGQFYDPQGYYVPIDGEYSVTCTIFIDSDDWDDSKVNMKARVVFPKNYNDPSEIPQYIQDKSLDILGDPGQFAEVKPVQGSNPQHIKPNSVYQFNFFFRDTFRKGDIIKPFIWFAYDDDPTNKWMDVTLDNFSVIPVWDYENIRPQINPALFLPDLSIQEFISEINNIYNLQFTVQEGVISIDYKDESQLYLQSAIDWTNKTDLKQAEIKRTAGQNNYKFEVGDIENAAIQNDLSTFTYTNPIKNNETIELKSEFVQAGERSMVWLRNPQSVLPTVNGTNVKVISHCENNAYENSLGEVYEGAIDVNYNLPPTLIKWNGLVDVFGSGSAFLWVGYRLALGNLIPGFNYDVAGSNVLFSNKFPSSSSIPINPQELFNSFQQELSFLSRSALIEVPVYLTPQDVAELDVRQPILIDDNLFQLVEIMGYNPARDGLTKVKLLRL